jgi:hypothetical protein
MDFVSTVLHIWSICKKGDHFLIADCIPDCLAKDLYVCVCGYMALFEHFPYVLEKSIASIEGTSTRTRTYTTNSKKASRGS